MNSSNYNMGDIKFLTKSCNSLTEQELQQCSELFSKHYGNWALNNPKHKQGPVKLGVKYYKDTMIKPDHYVSLAYDNDLLIGHAFYIRKKFDNTQYMSWVLQLVVHTNYRMRSIGKTLLYSIWGFSGDVARGLATSNPYTVKTLESVTFRKANPEIIYKNLDIIKKIGAEVSFMDNEKPYKVNLQQSIVDTDFYVDHSDIGDKIKKAYDDKWQLGELPEGHEWLAFTFKDQELREFTKNEFTKWIEYSEKELKEAYARMNIEKQPWAKIENTRSEVDFIMKKAGLSGKEKIADFGCGIGRHCIEFANRNYNVTGIDFVKSNIEKANLKANENNLVNVKFIEADCRTIELDEKYDLITCLYDVVGSFLVC